MKETKVSYHPTFEQFADNYLSTYYSGGVKVLRRIAGGPAMIVTGALAVIFAFDRLGNWLLRGPVILVGFVLALYGLFFTLGPLFNIFLVWLRREELFGEKALTTLELTGRDLVVNQNGHEASIPIRRVQSIQHREASTWILTFSDSMIFVPRAGLLSGDHDQFVQALERNMAEAENKDEG